MSAPKAPPTWDEIRSLIERADEVRRESEYLRAQAERARRRPEVWPDRRRPAERHDRSACDDRRRENGSTPRGRKGTS